MQTQMTRRALAIPHNARANGDGGVGAVVQLPGKHSGGKLWGTRRCVDSTEIEELDVTRCFED